MEGSGPTSNAGALHISGPSSGAILSVCRHVGRIRCTFVTISLTESASTCVRIRCAKEFCKRCAAKGVGRGSAGRSAPGLLEALRFAINHCRLDPKLSDLTAAAAEKKLLLQWDGVDFNSHAA
eukprot:2816355-Pleurochrysis_carterae.AAC.1